MNKYLKIIIITWIGIGSLIGGYLVIDPIQHKKINSFYNKDPEFFDKYKFYSGNEGEIILLITAVGAFMIGGIGYVLNKKKQ